MKIYSFLICSITILFVSCSSSSEDTGGPIANDDFLVIDENSSSGEANRVDVSANDNIGNKGGDTNNYSLVNGPSNGNATEVSDGVFEYIPNTGFFGDDSFTYKIADKDGNEDTASVFLTINEVPGPTAEDFANMDPNFPSFTSIDDTTPLDKQWVKVDALSDEFDGPFDTTKWYNSFWNYGNTPVFMREENSFTEDGKLCIKATLRSEPNWFQTARVHSIAKISYPMYTECSMKTAHISAFNTFWMNNGDIDNRDEIDIVENNSKPTQECIDTSMNTPNFPWTTHLFPTQMNSQYFIAKNSVTERHEDNYDTRWLLPENPKKDKTWEEDYHIVGCWWIDERTVQFYLDGEPAGKVTTNQDFTRELELIWDLWTADECFLGGLADKDDLNDDSINTMRVDWVRTWKLESK
ncbi:Ig-like domain-containing protein [Flavivirga algicola]|uniref:Family 16 glycosylhydrolase n=1 Tax=Flavivirga algicola TaxID=2729136 RepID=A0ABX1RWI2_9FLAO|nr:Ig-like domain-containing protein [Flavivirga algicola]NMH87365.1 family 16 glycosylhydrolase [Flavivirga algicola]